MSGSSLLVEVLPFAVGAGWAPTILGVQILLLSSGENAVSRTWALAIGRTIGIIILAFIGASLLSLLPDFHTGGPSWAQFLILVVAGILVAIGAYWGYRGRNKPHKSHSVSARFQNMSPWWLLPIGLGFAIPALPLFVPGLHVITVSDADLIWHALALVELIVLTSVLALVPPAAVSIWGTAAKPKLMRFHQWLNDESRPLLIGVLVLLSLLCFGFAVYQLVVLL